MRQCVIFWLCLFCGWVFSGFLPSNCCCLIALGLGMVKRFLALWCDSFFRKKWTCFRQVLPTVSPSHRFVGWNCRASTPLVWLPVQRHILCLQSVWDFLACCSYLCPVFCIPRHPFLQFCPHLGLGLFLCFVGFCTTKVKLDLHSASWGQETLSLGCKLTTHHAEINSFKDLTKCCVAVC